MRFRTEIIISESHEKINYQDKIFGLGSCFVTHIKNKLDYYQFQNQINTFGTVFNPVSIRKLLQLIVNQDFYDEKKLFFHQNLWKSFDLHSEFNQPDKNLYLQQVNEKITLAGQFLKTANWLFITLGTAWVYRHKSSGNIVNNCHKIPQKEFEKFILSPSEITHELNEIIHLAKTYNSKLKILLSISPVRHLKNGFIENQQSKAHLVTAVHQTALDILYFPSYEIMLDDLRDYRFYKADFIHPNELAIDYIWQKFSKSYISEEALPTMKKIDKIQQGLAHKSFNPGSPQNINRLNKLQATIQKIKTEYPWMVFT